MACSSMEVSFAVQKCPFLAKVAAQHGQEYAANLAVCPTAPAGAGGPPPGSEQAQQLFQSFELFHGPQGIVPLVSSTSKHPVASGCPFHAQALAAAAKEGSSKPERTPRAAPLPLATISLSFGSGPNFGDLFRPKPKPAGSSSNSSRKPQRPPGHGHGHAAGGSSSAPNAGGPSGAGPSSQHPASNPGGASSGSGSFKPQRPLTDPSSSGSSSAGGLAGNRGWSSPAAGGHGLQPPSAAAAGHAPLSSNPTGTGSLGASGSANSSGWLSMNSSSSSATAGRSGPAGGPQQHRAQPPGGTSNPRSGSSNGKLRGPGRGSGRPPLGKSGGRLTGGSSSGAGAAGAASASSSNAACPLRKWLGPMAGLVFNEYDKLVCPPPIMAARAALSRTSAVQTLRPQALPVKLVAVAAVAAAANLPCGAVREHFEKFSAGWFVAVHATIPFVAMLRKAVIMPKFAIAVTIGAAVLGQAVGARLERLRLQQLQQQQQAVVLEAAGGPAAKAPLAAGGVPGTAAAVLPRGSATGGRAVAGVGEGGQAGWREKLMAGAAAGFAALPGEQQQLADCVREVVTGLGSLMPQLPVVRA